MEISRKQLVSVATELNEKILDTNQPIDTDLSQTQLESLIKEAARDIVAPSDKGNLSKETWDIITFYRDGSGKAASSKETKAETKKDAKPKKEKPAKEAKAEKAGDAKGKKDAKPAEKPSEAKGGNDKADAAPPTNGSGRKAPKRSDGPTLADFMDKLLASEPDPDKLVSKLKAEVEKRGVKTSPTLSTLRAHLRHRQGQGQLKEVKVPGAAAA